MIPAVRRLLALLAFLLAPALAPRVAAADIGDDLFQITLLYEQAYKGFILLDGDALKVGTNGTQGVDLRLELLAGRSIGIGVEGSASWIRMGHQFVPLVYVGSQPFGMTINDGRHLLYGGGGFLRVRFLLNDGRGEYYLIGGGGVGMLNQDGSDPNQYGSSLAGANALGWSSYARFGLRGELTPGLGALVEVGWVHREHLGAFEHTLDVGGSSVTRHFDYVINQLSIEVGWYFSP